ncbi:hypothetical protein Lfu02_12740 [Longispora fulva]|uniref:Uncharacterized protein n=1 Tax=Longispora fulva TaxID=619741 RepID=A0A8J7GQ52_9ACTN|nr:hypothetical protein [Longispora fulva]MBG6134866.1 hypothetical protein [Longispora fulva]GIG56902.1 hypothetical protein Lfu02_12740 [Longispora fulva]
MGDYYSAAAQVVRTRAAAHRAGDDPAPEPPRRFALRRWRDDTGVSGLGIVAYGVAWTDDKVVLRWLGTTTGVAQVCVFDSLDDLMRIHGHGGRSEVVWVDPHSIDLAADVRIGGYVD